MRWLSGRYAIHWQTTLCNWEKSSEENLDVVPGGGGLTSYCLAHAICRSEWALVSWDSKEKVQLPARCHLCRLSFLGDEPGGASFLIQEPGDSDGQIERLTCLQAKQHSIFSILCEHFLKVAERDLVGSACAHNVWSAMVITPLPDRHRGPEVNYERFVLCTGH